MIKKDMCDHSVDINEMVGRLPAEFMLFSERKELAEEYEEWVKKPLEDGSKIKDCALSVITFMKMKGFRQVNDGSVVITKSEFERLCRGEKTFNQVVRILVERFVGIICKDATEIALPGGYSDMVFVEDIKDKAVAIIRGELDVFDEGKKGGSN